MEQRVPGVRSKCSEKLVLKKYSCERGADSSGNAKHF